MSADGASPLLAPRDLAAPLAWRAGHPISGARFLSDAAALAERLPAYGAAVNLCVDRYAFACAFAAALMRGHCSLLPPDARSETLSRLFETDSDAYALTDDPALPTSGLPTIRLDAALPGRGATQGKSAPAVPSFDDTLHAASLLTSGSTGTPQPHAKSWRTLVINVEAAAARLARCLGRPSLAGLTLVSTVPPQHSYGLESTVLLGLLGGAAFESGRPFFPANIAAALAAVPHPRALVTTPFHLKTLLSAGLALPPVELVLSATALLSPQLALDAEAATGGVLVEIYGSTETGQMASRRTTQTEVWENFGSIRVRSAPAEIAAEPPRFVAEGGHISEPTVLADVLDLVDARQFRLLGRANDLIHVAGRRSSLAHLNYHLNSIAGVEDGAFWLPDDEPDGVVRPIALVIAPRLEAQQIIDALRRKLEPVFVPRRVLQVAMLPRESTGKLTFGALRAFALAAMADSANSEKTGLSNQETGTVVHAVPENHPVFGGHFPGQPLMPGALLLAEVFEIICSDPRFSALMGPAPTLAAAKFLSPVRPGAELEIALKADAKSGAVSFDIRCGDTRAVTGRWTSASVSAIGPVRKAGG